jgi:hypothetical protein
MAQVVDKHCATNNQQWKNFRKQINILFDETVNYNNKYKPRNEQRK